ncbi:MAG TPA: hypothetical protein PKY82_28860 [Pyrinomonadaceae bacterium]|nr:hypothetical protein [Pyrinomonadaceae bacterium]
MEIISPENRSKFIYDKFNSKVLKPDELLMINQFHKTDYYFVTLQQYEVSGEWIIWVSSDLFAEFQFEDVWLIFSRLERTKAEAVYSSLKERFAGMDKQKTPKLFRQYLNSVFDEIEKEINQNREISVAA